MMIAFELWPYSTRRPQVTAAYGAGHCLWLAGFDPADAPSAESLTWTGINVATGKLAAVVRTPRNASRVRDISPTAVLSSYLDTDGVWRLERYPLPKVDCGGPDRVASGHSYRSARTGSIREARRAAR